MNFKNTKLFLMFIQTALFSCDETILSKDKGKIKETLKASIKQIRKSVCEFELKINESYANDRGETDRNSKICDNRSDINSMHDIGSFISESLTNLLERNREIIYCESSYSNESSETFSFNVDFDYKSLHDDSDSKSLDDDLKFLSDTVIRDNKENPVVWDNRKSDRNDGLSKSFMKMGESLKAESNYSKEKKALENKNIKETEEDFDAIFDSLMQMCDQESKKLDKLPKIVGFKLKNEPNYEIKPSSTTKLDKSIEKKNLDVYYHQEIDSESNFGSCQVLFSNFNELTKETSQEKFLDNKLNAIQKGKKKLCKGNPIISWIKRSFKFKKGSKNDGNESGTK